MTSRMFGNRENWMLKRYDGVKIPKIDNLIQIQHQLIYYFIPLNQVRLVCWQRKVKRPV